MTDFVPTGHKTLSDAIECVAAITQGEKREAQEALRQLLYNSRVPSQAIGRSGQGFDIPAYVWGGEKWNEALRTGRISFEYAAYSNDVHGRVIIPEAALKSALNSYGVTGGDEEQVEKKTRTRQRDERMYTLFEATSKSNPQVKRRKIFNMLMESDPDLFDSRRGAARDKKISYERFNRIIREQQAQ